MTSATHDDGPEPALPKRRGVRIAIAAGVVAVLAAVTAVVVVDSSARAAAREQAQAFIDDYEHASARYDRAAAEAQAARERAVAYSEHIAVPAQEAVAARGDSFGADAVGAVTEAGARLAELIEAEPAVTEGDEAFTGESAVDDLTETLHRGSEDEREALTASVEAAVDSFDESAAALAEHQQTLRAAVEAADGAIVAAAAAGRDAAASVLESQAAAPAELRDPLDQHRASLAELAETALPVERFGEEGPGDALRQIVDLAPAFHDARAAVAAWEPPPPPPPSSGSSSSGASDGGSSGRTPRSCVRYQWPYGMVVGVC